VQAPSQGQRAKTHNQKLWNLGRHMNLKVIAEEGRNRCAISFLAAIWLHFNSRLYFKQAKTVSGLNGLSAIVKMYEVWFFGMVKKLKKERGSLSSRVHLLTSYYCCYCVLLVLVRLTLVIIFRQFFLLSVANLLLFFATSHKMLALSLSS
jgi:hypothetical protein